MGSGRSPGPDPGEAARVTQPAGRPAGATDESGSTGPVTGPRWRRTAGLAAAAVLLLGLVAWLGGRGSPPAAGVKRWLGVGAVCGNGQVESGEECDDGNASPADRCLPSCRLASCGDGQIRTHVEECDDGNQVDNDGCSRSCLTCPAGSDSFSSPAHRSLLLAAARQPAALRDAAANCARDGGQPGHLRRRRRMAGGHRTAAGRRQLAADVDRPAPGGTQRTARVRLGDRRARAVRPLGHPGAPPQPGQPGLRTAGRGRRLGDIRLRRAPQLRLRAPGLVGVPARRPRLPPLRRTGAVGGGAGGVRRPRRPPGHVRATRPSRPSSPAPSRAPTGSGWSTTRARRPGAGPPRSP